MALARSFNKPEIQLHFANSANSVATSVLSTVCNQKRTDWIEHNPLCCHCAKTGKQIAKQNKTHKNKQQTKQHPKTARLVSADQFIVLAMHKKDFCEPGINKSTMRKQGSPQLGASRSQSAAARTAKTVLCESLVRGCTVC